MDRLNKFFSKLVNRLDQLTRVNSRPIVIAMWLLTAIFFGWILFENWGQIRRYLADPNPWSMIGTAVGYGLSIVTAMFGWSLIMGALAPGIRRSAHNRIYALTLVARRLPGSLWYVGGRLVLYRKLDVPGSFTAFASGLELTVIVITGLILGLVLLPQRGVSDVLVLGLIGIGLGILFVSLSPRTIKWLSIRRGVELTGPIKWHVLLGVIGAYLATWIAGGILVFSVIGIFVDLDREAFPYVLGSWGLAGALGSLTIFLPTTFGVAEISLSLLLSGIMPLPLAGIVAIMTRLLTTIYDFILAAVFYVFIRDPDRIGDPGSQANEER
ncbi:MAG TPA: hypothetical protein VMN57_02275 [Anaerolineales bacterium]|nr:hypothetical protein [Anaerolineales bacterium]